MSRTRFSKKSRRHTRRHTKRRTNKRRSRRVRKFGGAQDYSDEDMNLFRKHINDKFITRSFTQAKKDELLGKLSSMPYDQEYVYNYDTGDAKKDPYLQGKDRIDAFVQLGQTW